MNQGRYLQLQEQKYVKRIVLKSQKTPDSHLFPADEPGESPMHCVQSEQCNYTVVKIFALSCGCFQKDKCNTVT